MKKQSNIFRYSGWKTFKQDAKRQDANNRMDKVKFKTIFSRNFHLSVVVSDNSFGEVGFGFDDNMIKKVSTHPLRPLNSFKC